MNCIKVTIVDDHQLFRDGLKTMLNEQAELEVVADYADGATFLNSLEHNSDFDVCLLDLTLPEKSGLEVLKAVKAKKLKFKVVVLSMHNDGAYIAQSVRNGAFGYLLKNANIEEVVAAVTQVYKGKKYFSEDITDTLLNVMSEDIQDNKDLTSRESEVLVHISEGLTTKEIADKLIISSRTVETHRVNMMKKLNVKNTAELIKVATKIGLL